jgi:PTH1 family peptidyl-tRNA hydrolase
MPKPLSLLIASIGNPSPYQNTLHSAGHTLLQRLRLLLPTGHPYEPWSLHKGGLLSRPPPQINKRFTLTGFKNAAEEYPTLWQSGSFMNVSGPAVKKVWEKWKEGKAEECALVIVHDELEREMGIVSVKVDGHTSAK